MKKFLFATFVCIISAISVYAQENEITGIVRSMADKQPLMGVTVVDPLTRQGGITDENGIFKVKVSSKTNELEFAFLGMRKKKQKISPNMIVLMEEDAIEVNDVIVTGYGNYNRGTFTGSASGLSSARINNIPSLSVEQKLQGEVSGIQVTSTSSMPGAPSSVRIRGMGSINASNEPLYVVDGVPVLSGNLSNKSSTEGMNTGSSIMASLNPADIESMTVIKDAAAASLYGSRAANGVIIITTKAGQSGKLKVNLRTTQGFSDFATPYRPVMNGDDRRSILYEGLYNYATDIQNQSTSEAKAFADDNIDSYAWLPSTGWEDWKARLFRKGRSQNYEASVSGGDDKTQFFSSLSYTKQEGISRNSDLSRFTGRLNLLHTEGRLKLGANILFASMQQNANTERTSFSNPLLAISVMATPSDKAFTEDGDYNMGSFLGYGKPANPRQAQDLNKFESNTTRSFNTLTAAYEIAKGYTIKQLVGFDYNLTNDFVYYHPETSDGVKNNGSASRSVTERKKLNTSTSFNWVKSIGKHDFDALAAYEVEMFDSNILSASKSNFPNTHVEALDNAATIESAGGSWDKERLLSLVTRANYNYNDTYYLGASFRRDGSSRLAPSTRWGNFWSVSGAWRISNEKFMQASSDILNEMKLRLSYGVNGTMPGGYYGYLGVYSYGFNYNDQPGSMETIQPNPNLSWEKNYALNVGFDIGLINRVQLSVDMYNRDTRDLIMNVPSSSTTGFNTYLKNVGRINNKGIEVEIRSTNIIAKDFSWQTNFNLSHNTQKIKALDGKQTQMISTWYNTTFIHEIGKEYHTFYLREFAGVDPETGKGTYYINAPLYDDNGNLTGRDRSVTTNPAEAHQIATKKAAPDVTMGLTNSFNYKFIDLSFTLTSSLGGYSIDEGARLQGYSGGGSQYTRNVPAYYKDRWQHPGDQAAYPKFIYGQTDNESSYPSTLRLHSTNHLRLKSVSVGATIPQKWTSALGVNQIRLFFNGSNLWTWAAYKGYDPETQSNGVVAFDTPALKTFLFGVDIKF
ncbi:MAG: SusC/RagA family TonB-linked outer membrane protein [Bacteroidales bacterium]